MVRREKNHKYKVNEVDNQKTLQVIILQWAARLEKEIIKKMLA